MQLFVQYQSYVVASDHADEEFGAWYEDWSFSVESVSMSYCNALGFAMGNEEFSVNFEADAGDTVYVLSMTYDSGDSFGNSSGLGEVLWVFKDQGIALAAYHQWRQALEQKVNKVRFEVDGPGKSEITLSNPCNGYFENCGQAHLQSFILKD